MARIICTICMRVTLRPALMTGGNDIIGDPFTKPFIKDKVLADKFVWKT